LLMNDPRAPKVYRVRPALVPDSYGDPVESPTASTRSQIVGATVEYVDSEEDGSVVRRERVLFVPRAYDLTKDDRVDVGGELWRIDGDPVTFRGRASGTYTSAVLKRSAD
jgi:hypothetical protein